MFTIYSNTTEMQKYYIILRNKKKLQKNIFVTFFRHIPVDATTEKMLQRKIAATNINTHRSDAKNRVKNIQKKKTEYLSIIETL